MLHHRFLLRACSLGIFGDNILCRSCSGGLCLGGLLGESSPFVLLLLTTCCVSGYDRLCVCLYFFFSVSFFLSLLCFCVGQVQFGRNKFVSVIAFFLMKNVLKHGRKKKSLCLIWLLAQHFLHLSKSFVYMCPPKWISNSQRRVGELWLKLRADLKMSYGSRLQVQFEEVKNPK